MNTISSLFHRKKATQDQTTDPTQQPTEPTPKPKAEETTSSQQVPQSTPQYAPGTGPQAHGQTHNASNIGMAGGAILGSTIDGGGNGVMGMVEGGVAANMIMQRVQQEQKHQYFREQAINYRGGRPADGVPRSGGVEERVMAGGEGGRDRDRGDRKETRDEKRKKRWDRRAKRRDGGKEDVSEGSGSA